MATHGRSLLQLATLAESRLSAVLVKRFAPREGTGRHEIALQASLQSGLAGSLDVSWRSWALAPRTERGVWLTWRRGL